MDSLEATADELNPQEDTYRGGGSNSHGVAPNSF